ncbi:MAG: DMT family transporter [Gammaproteobacteria bacterium]|nr:DMT family transporter [Gammaproteobacteria bacterium]
MRDNRILIAVCLGILGSMIWGAHSSVSVSGLRAGFDSFDIAAARVLGAALGIIPILLARGISVVPTIQQIIWLTLGAGVPFGLLNVAGLQFAPISHTGAISLGCVPLITAFIANRFFGDRISLSHVIALGILLAALGFIWSAHPFEWIHLLGDLCFFGSACLWASYGLNLRRWNLKSMQGVIAITLGSLPYLVWYFLARERTFLSDLDQGMLQVMYQGFIVGVLAVLIYGKVLEFIGPMMGTMFLAFSPFLIPFMAFLVLGDPIDIGDVTGLALVVVSMIIAFWKPFDQRKGVVDGGL